MIAAHCPWWIFVCALVGRCHADFNTTDAKCKNSLDTCFKNVSVVLDYTGLKGIPKSKKDVDIVCKGFKIGMKCLDDYSNLCLTLDEKNMITENINGATSTFKFLCDDEVFQKDYLKYTDCYRVINSDWDECVDKFTSLVREEPNNRSEEARVLDQCCAKHGFLNCVFNKSKIKCGVEEAIFIKKIAATLSENKLVISTCRYIKLGHCNTAQHIAYNVSTIVFNLFIVIWFYKI